MLNEIRFFRFALRFCDELINGIVAESFDNDNMEGDDNVANEENDDNDDCDGDRGGDDCGDDRCDDCDFNNDNADRRDDSNDDVDVVNRDKSFSLRKGSIDPIFRERL